MNASDYLKCPYKGAARSVDEQELENRRWAREFKDMTKWGFDEVEKNFNAVGLDMEKNVSTPTIAKLYRVGTNLSNCLTCLNQQSDTSIISGVKPPTLEQYFNRES